MTRSENFQYFISHHVNLDGPSRHGTASLSVLAWLDVAEPFPGSPLTMILGGPLVFLLSLRCQLHTGHHGHSLYGILAVAHDNVPPLLQLSHTRFNLAHSSTVNRQSSKVLVVPRTFVSC